MGLPVVDELGRRIDEHWRRYQYDFTRLPAIAAEALTAANLLSRLSPDDILHHVLDGGELAQQQDSEARFGQPPVTLFRTPRFYIDALHWVDGSTTIHQHGFSGAFQVLAGSSIETTYSFQSEQPFDGHFVFGRLQVLSTQLHQAGAIRPIASGTGGLIHSLFHLDRPSITIVVRTFRDAATGPQFNYTRNGIAADPFFTDVVRDRVLQMVGLLRRIDHPRLESLIGDLIARSDLHTAYRVLESCAKLSDEALVGRLVARVSHADAAARIAEAFREERRVSFLYSRRTHVRVAEPRFFLGVLLNARRRSDALELVAQRWPDTDAGARAASCLRELSAVAVKLQVAGTPWLPNVLGLPEIDAQGEQTVAAELNGVPPADLAADQLVANLRSIPALRALWTLE